MPNPWFLSRLKPKQSRLKTDKRPTFDFECFKFCQFWRPNSEHFLELLSGFQKGPVRTGWTVCQHYLKSRKKKSWAPKVPSWRIEFLFKNSNEPLRVKKMSAKTTNNSNSISSDCLHAYIQSFLLRLFPIDFHAYTKCMLRDQRTHFQLNQKENS